MLDRAGHGANLDEDIQGDLVIRRAASVVRAIRWGHRHWRQANIGRRFRLLFRHDSQARAIVFAWVNDEQALRSSGSQKNFLQTRSS